MAAERQMLTSQRLWVKRLFVSRRVRRALRNRERTAESESAHYNSPSTVASHPPVRDRRSTQTSIKTIIYLNVANRVLVLVFLFVQRPPAHSVGSRGIKKFIYILKGCRNNNNNLDSRGQQLLIWLPTDGQTTAI